MAKTYDRAESVEQLAGSIIPAYHPNLCTAKIAYLFVDKEAMKNGKPVLGTVKKVTGEYEFLTENTHFIITVPNGIWNDLPNDQRAALIDHLLERCGAEEDEESGEMKFKLRQPDVQEFTSILQRHGAWNESLREFVGTASEIGIDDTAQIQQTVQTRTTRS